MKRRRQRKRAKYDEIIQWHPFVLIAIETLGPINMDGQRFLDSLGERLSSVSGDPRETTFLYQDYLYSSIFSIRLPFVVLSFPRQLPKVNSRTRFNFVFNPRDLYYLIIISNNIIIIILTIYKASQNPTQPSSINLVSSNILL